MTPRPAEWNKRRAGNAAPPGADALTEDQNATGDAGIIDWAAFAKTRAELGSGFVRILGYFREDGVKSVASIEAAMRAGKTAALVLPAHTLKSEARQFGADKLGDAAEEIEFTSRSCVESHRFPDEIVAHVVELRRLFDATNALLEREMNPLMERRSGFGKKTSSNQTFGRI